MKKIVVILTVCMLFVIGCSKKDSEQLEKYTEKGKVAIANNEYEKALNFFTLAKEEDENNEEVLSLYNQTKNLVEAIDSKEKENYDVAMKLCESINQMESNTNIVKDAANKVKEEIEESIEKDKNEKLEKQREENNKNLENDNIKSSNKQYYKRKLSQVENEVNALEKSPEFSDSTTISMNNLASESLERWDNLLNEIYDDLKNQLSQNEMSDLRNKQRNWIKYRDSEADKVMEEYKGGTMMTMQYLLAKAELTRQRCYELVNLYMY